MSTKTLAVGLFAAITTAVLATGALLAPAKAGHIRYLDKLAIQSEYSKAFGEKEAQLMNVERAPDADGNMTASYSVGDKPAYFSAQAFLPTDPKELENNLVLSTASSFDKANLDNSLNMVMMLFQGEKKNMVFNYNGTYAQEFASKALANNSSFQSECLIATSDTKKSGQRVINANINCDLTLRDLVGLITQDDPLISRHTLISHSLLLQTGAYEDMWTRFDPSYAVKDKQVIANDNRNFKKGSHLYLTFVTNPTAMDKGINFVYKP
ncbi:MAG: hypothetical protein RSD49_01485 [Hafnia sp.]